MVITFEFNILVTIFAFCIKAAKKWKYLREMIILVKRHQYEKKSSHQTLSQVNSYLSISSAMKTFCNIKVTFCIAETP